MPVAESIALASSIISATGSVLETYNAAKETKSNKSESSKGGSAPCNTNFGQSGGTSSFQMHRAFVLKPKVAGMAGSVTDAIRQTQQREIGEILRS